jgi:hypothetical protein
VFFARDVIETLRNPRIIITEIASQYSRRPAQIVRPPRSTAPVSVQASDVKAA